MKKREENMGELKNGEMEGLEEREIEKLVIHYKNGEEETIEKGFFSCGLEEGKDGEYKLNFSMCNISGRDLKSIIMGFMQLGDEMGFFDELINNVQEQCEKEEEQEG